MIRVLQSRSVDYRSHATDEYDRFQRFPEFSDWPEVSPPAPVRLNYCCVTARGGILSARRYRSRCENIMINCENLSRVRRTIKYMRVGRDKIFKIRLAIC